jgi:arginine/ornithine transport system permease protein
MLDLHGYGLSILQGTLMTVALGLSALLVAVVLGLAAALAKLSGGNLARRLATVYTTIIRGVPDLVMMLLIFYGGQVLINRLGQAVGYSGYIDIDPFTAGVATIGFIFGAYMAETFRGAILAVPRGQLEAGYAFGMSRRQVVQRILLPQMVQHALPGFGNNWLVLLKATALVSIIGLDDLVRKAGLAAGATQKPFTFWLAVALVYLGLTTLSVVALQWGERWSARGERRA